MKIIIGTANFKNFYGYNRFEKKDFSKVKKFIKNKNIKYFDTAENYKSYYELKKIINAKSLIIFKFELNKEKNLQKKIQNVLKFFSLQQIYAILIHDKIDVKNTQFRKNINILISLKKSKKIKKLGISIYEEKDLIAITKIFNPDIIQLPLNVFDQRFSESNLIKSLKNQGTEIHARSIFLQGKLLNKNIDDQIIFFNEKYFNKFDNFCLKNNLSRFNACIQFLLQNKKLINYVVIGVSNLKELLKIYKELNNKKNRHIDFTSLKINKMVKLIDPRKW